MKRFILATMLTAASLIASDCYRVKSDTIALENSELARTYATMPYERVIKTDKYEELKDIKTLVVLKKSTKFCVLSEQFLNYIMKVRLENGSTYWINSRRDAYIKID